MKIVQSRSRRIGPLVLASLGLTLAAAGSAFGSWTVLDLPDTDNFNNITIAHLPDGRFVYGHNGSLVRQDTFGNAAASPYPNAPAGDFSFVTTNFTGTGGFSSGPVNAYTSANLATSFTSIGNFQTYDAFDYGTSALLVMGTDGGNSDLYHLDSAGVATTLIDGVSAFSGGIARDTAGNVYVADNDDLNIYRFTSAQIANAVAGSPLAIGDGTLVTNLGVSASLAVDLGTNRLYASGFQKDGIQVFDLGSSATSTLVPGLSNAFYQVHTFSADTEDYVGWLNRSGFSGGDSVQFGYQLASTVPIPEPAPWFALLIAAALLLTHRRARP